MGIEDNQETDKAVIKAVAAKCGLTIRGLADTTGGAELVKAILLAYKIAPRVHC